MRASRDFGPGLCWLGRTNANMRRFLFLSGVESETSPFILPQITCLDILELSCFVDLSNLWVDLPDPTRIQTFIPISQTLKIDCPEESLKVLMKDRP